MGASSLDHFPGLFLLVLVQDLGEQLHELDRQRKHNCRILLRRDLDQGLRAAVFCGSWPAGNRARRALPAVAGQGKQR
jgi:hypothetical protein